MTKQKKIIVVSASFCKPEELTMLLRKYSQHHDHRFSYWEEFAFTSEMLPSCDAILVFNTPYRDIHTHCNNTVAFMMEPGIPSEHPWMFQGLEHYQKIYSPVHSSSNTILSHGFLGWHFHHCYEDLKNLSYPEKTKTISCIASNLTKLKGHQLRMRFINTLKQELPQIDFFGRGIRFLPDKMEGLLPYRYSIAIENTSAADYFTEKINDCFLAGTIPFYYGCQNISRYFPEKSYIKIDIEKPAIAIEKIRDILANDNWQERSGALEEARELVLNKYQPLAGAADILMQMPEVGKKEIYLEKITAPLIKRIYRSLREKIIN